MEKIKYIFLLFTVLLVSCEQEDEDIQFRITNIEYEDGGVKIEWNQPNIKNIQYYEILRSVDGKRFRRISKVYTPNPAVGIVSSYADYIYAEEEVFYYKVAAIGDKLTVTEKKEISVPKPFTLYFKPKEAYLLPGKNQILSERNEALYQNTPETLAHQFRKRT